MIEIKHITYHIVNKEQNGKASNEINPTPFTPNEAHQNFLDILTKAYKGRAGKGFGSFDSDEDSFPMPRLLKDYFSDGNFQQLTERIMNILLNKIDNQPFATGGKVFISHYTDQGNEYILIAILSDRTGFSAQNWTIRENEILDIENLKYAGRINLTAWQANELRYISFLKGKGEISTYFKETLSCNDALIAREETKRLVDLLEEFIREQEFNFEEKTEFFNNVKSYLIEISNTGDTFSTEEFSNRFYPNAPQLLQEKLSNPETGIQDGFTPDKASLRKLVTFVGKTETWKLSFNRSAISNGDISIDNNRIMINNPTPELLEAFE